MGVTGTARECWGDGGDGPRADGGLNGVAPASIAESESTKSVSEVYCPMSGTVVETNGELGDRPEAINEDAYGQGWIFTIGLSDPAELDGLMDAAAYEAFLAG